MSQTEAKQKRNRDKEKVTSDLDGVIAAIEKRMQMRKIAFDYENAKDQQKLDELKLQQEALTLIK